MSTNRVTKVTLVGCGAASELLHAPAIKQLIDCEVLTNVVVIDRSEARIEKLHRILPHATGHADLSEVIHELDGSLVIVALPHNLHAATTIKALEAGAHVLCEKPMARTSVECDQMLAAATRAGRLLAVGHFRRFFPVTKLIREWIKQEHLGRLRSFRFLEGEIYSWPAVSNSYSLGAAGGGVLMDAGAHTMDLLLWWMGPVAELDYRDDASGGVEANCVMRLRMANGVSGYVQMSRDWPLANQYLLDFEKGWLLFTYDVADTFVWGWHGESVAQHAAIENAFKPGFDHLPKPTNVARAFSSFIELQLLNVLSAIQVNEALICPGSEARDAVVLIERCYAQRQHLRPAWLSKIEQSRLEVLAS
jgi:predicted dehydrogenase